MSNPQIILETELSDRSMDERLEQLYVDAVVLFSQDERCPQRTYPVQIQIDGDEILGELKIAKSRVQSGGYRHRIFLDQAGDGESTFNYSIMFDRPRDGRQHLIQEWTPSSGGGQYVSVNYNPIFYHFPELELYARGGTPKEAKIIGMMEQTMEYIFQGADGGSSLDFSGTTEG